MSTPKGIPSVDLSLFHQGDRDGFVASLGEALSETGFVAVKNHGLPEELVKRLYAEVRAFFNLPEEVKKRYDIPGMGGQRGYTPFGREHAKGSNAGDLKEFWHFGQHVTDEDEIGSEYPANVYCRELTQFNSTGMEAYRKLETCGKTLLQAIALYLGLPEDWFEPGVNNGNSILRAIHYPPITEEPRNAIRAGAHEDINLITLLIGASADGLEILTRSGEWIAVTEVQDHIVMNVGDMLQRLTNNHLRSTTHRVVNPPREKWGQPRYSIPFFMHPRSDMPLNCLPHCVTEQHPKAYEDCTAGEYLSERLREIGLVK